MLPFMVAACVRHGYVQVLLQFCFCGLIQTLHLTTTTYKACARALERMQDPGIKCKASEDRLLH